MTCELPPSPFLAPTPDGVAITALIDGQDATTAQEGIPLLFRYVLMEVCFLPFIYFFLFLTTIKSILSHFCFVCTNMIHFLPFAHTFLIISSLCTFQVTSVGVVDEAQQKLDAAMNPSLGGSPMSSYVNPSSLVQTSLTVEGTQLAPWNVRPDACSSKEQLQECPRGCLLSKRVVVPSDEAGKQQEEEETKACSIEHVECNGDGMFTCSCPLKSSKNVKSRFISIRPLCKVVSERVPTVTFTSRDYERKDYACPRVEVINSNKLICHLEKDNSLGELQIYLGNYFFYFIFFLYFPLLLFSLLSLLSLLSLFFFFFSFFFHQLTQRFSSSAPSSLLSVSLSLSLSLSHLLLPGGPLNVTVSRNQGKGIAIGATNFFQRPVITSVIASKNFASGPLTLEGYWLGENDVNLMTIMIGTKKCLNVQRESLCLLSLCLSSPPFLSPFTQLTQLSHSLSLSLSHALTHHTTLPLLYQSHSTTHHPPSQALSLASLVFNHKREK